MQRSILISAKYNFDKSKCGFDNASEVFTFDFQIYQFVGINRDAMVSRYIHWHLESLGKSLLTLASAVSFNFSRMAGARGTYFCNAQF